MWFDNSPPFVAPYPVDDTITLPEWTYDLVEELVQDGRSESDRHDFKFRLPDKKTLTKLCCSFANSSGGFVVLGVKQRSNHWIPEGIDPYSEMASEFGQKVRADPTVPFEPPRVLALPLSRKVIYVFSVPRSPVRPHLPSDPAERIFWKRTNTGCQQMTLDEIRSEFMNYEERREKLKLLFIELLENKKILAEFLKIPERTGQYSLLTLDSSVLGRLLVDLYSVIQQDPALVDKLLKLRTEIRATNSAITIFFFKIARYFASVQERYQEIDQHNGYLRQQAGQLTPLIDQAVGVLKLKFGLVDPLRTTS